MLSDLVQFRLAQAFRLGEKPFVAVEKMGAKVSHVRPALLATSRMCGNQGLGKALIHFVNKFPRTAIGHADLSCRS